MSQSAYPQPDVTETNRPLIEGWRRGELFLQQCADCEMLFFYPRELCPNCWSRNLRWSQRTGRGSIVSYSLVYSHVTEPFKGESPTVLAEIALTDGGALLARVVTDHPERITSGMPVELVPLPDAARYPLPTFRPAA